MPDRLKTSLGIWALGGMITRFVPVGYQPEHGSESTAEKVRRAVDGLGDLMDDYEFHYPYELSRRQPRRGPRGARRPRDLLPGQRPAPRPAQRQGRALLARRRRPRRGAARHARRLRVRRARSARTSSSGRGSRATTTPSRPPTRESWARFIDGVGQAATALGRPRPEALPRAQELRAGHEDLHAQHRDDAARHPQAARRGHRQRPGQHGLAAPAHERRAPARVRRAAGRRGAARPPARQLGLGHLRRRQHGRRDGVHGDRRARARAAPRRLRRQRRAPGLRPVPVHRGPGRGRQALGRAVALHRRGRRSASTATPCARRSSARTPSPPTSSSTPRWARPHRRGYDAPAGTRRRHLVGQGHRDRRATAPCWPSPSAATRCRRRVPAGASRTPRTGGAGRRRCSTSSTPPARPASGCRARCTASSRSTRRRARCARRSCGTTGARRRSATRSRSASASSASSQLTGNRALAGFTAPKLLWLAEHEPEVYGRIAHILLPKDYVRLQAHRRARDRRRRRLGHAALRRRRARLERRGRRRARRRPGVAAEGLRVARRHRRDPRRRAGRRRRGRPGRGRARRRRGGRGRPGLRRARARAASSSPPWTATRTTPRRACTPSATPCRRRGTSWA